MLILFLIFSIVLVAAALRVITARNPVHAVLSLVVCFVASSGLWLLIEAEFLAVVLVLVYVGAVMVLFLFVVMMLDISIATLREGFVKAMPFGAAIAFLLFVLMFFVVNREQFGVEAMVPPVPAAADYSNSEALGTLLYTDYLYPFEVAAVLLLVAIVAAIALTMRRRGGTKMRDPAEQVAVRRADRVRLISMSAATRATDPEPTVQPEDDASADGATKGA
ncbi:MAG: NADH-quinone oxidoreductase subunit J [Gammaproteobacteria bacterium]|nr:NADH-quinone oxidoreductase subunit J [Gammaproteobacteria bacterium]